MSNYPVMSGVEGNGVRQKRFRVGAVVRRGRLD